jgi:hypothetical protein
MEQTESTEFLIEIINQTNGQSAVFSTEQESFPQAMADAYVQKHNISKATGDDWKIVSVLDKTHFVSSNRRLP